MILELTRPRLNGRSVRFDARRLETADQGLAHYRGRILPNPPRRFEEASLFVDAVLDDDETLGPCLVPNSPPGTGFSTLTVTQIKCESIGGWWEGPS